MLNWVKRFNIFCFLDNQNYAIQPHRYECILAAGVADCIDNGDLQQLNVFLSKNAGWVFGHLSYHLKNFIYNLHDEKENKIDFPLFYFFRPQFLFLIEDDQLTITAPHPDLIYKEIEKQTISNGGTVSKIDIQQKLTKEQYIDKIVSLQKHILRGDCYEINFCQEFFSENAEINPADVFQKLMSVSPNPFSVFYRIKDKYLICASPERFLMKQGNEIISQPIKGTIKRNLLDIGNEKALKNELIHSAKDRAENVMVVDLVRNDLSKICEEGTVKVKELFAVYTFPQVHQMISTIKGVLKKEINFSQIIEATFPMGSMTGAPKHRVMQLIDQYETQSRGIFSGSVGYISPNGNFDFNVVIRSLMYNAANKYLSYQVGSGITFYSQPEKEWEECLLKAEAIKKVLEEN